MANRPQLRLALVLYGGISLAVYMNGVTQEILALLRAAHALRLKAEGRALDWALRQERENPYCALLEAASIDVVADVIAGTSAGGLNGLLLAKALAVGAPDMSVMTRIWLDVAQIDQLAAFDKEPQSMLSGRLLEERLAAALTSISAQRNADLAQLVDVLDLFVPATDVRGHRWSRRDQFGEGIDGVAHKFIFHLRKRTPHGQRASLGYARNDFAPTRRDPVLAKIGRATAAFPAAFPPVQIGAREAEEAGLTDLLDGVDRETARAGIWFADGGILLNKPFEPVLDALQGRYADGPVKRVLAYLEPDPGHAPSPAQTEPHVLETAAAGFLLPMSQDIADSLAMLDRENQRRRERSLWLQPGALMAGAQAAVQCRLPAAPSLEPDALDQPADLTPWAEYRSRLTRLRTLLTDALDAALAGLGVGDGQQRSQAIRAVLAEIPLLANAAAEQPGPPDEIDRFLTSYDVEYHTGRIRYQMARCRQARLAGTGAQNDPREAALRHGLETWENARWAVSRAGRLKQQPRRGQERASALDAAMPDLVAAVRTAGSLTAPARAVVKGLADHLKSAKADADIWEQQGGMAESGFTEAAPMFNYFAAFHDYATEGEESEIGLFRFSPDAATDWVRKSSAAKLAGEKAGHFAAFFSRLWRANDIMWGRLDGAELLTKLVVREAALAQPGPDGELTEACYPAVVQAALEQRRRLILAESPEALNLPLLRQMCGVAAPAPAVLPAGGLGPRLAMAWSVLAGGQVAAAAMDAGADTAFIRDPATSYDGLRRYLETGQAVGEEGFGTLPPKPLAGAILQMLDNLTVALAKPAPTEFGWAVALQKPLVAVMRPVGWVARLLLLPGQGLMQTVKANLTWLASLVGGVLLMLQGLGAIWLSAAGWGLLFLLFLPALVAGFFRTTWVKAAVAGVLLLLGIAGALLPWLMDAQAVAGAQTRLAGALAGWAWLFVPLGRLLPATAVLFAIALAALALLRRR